MSWVWSNFPMIWDLTVDHLALSVIPIVVGFVISIPLGYWASRSRITKAVLLSVFGVLYTLPSVVLLVVVPIALGLALLDPNNLILALTIYAIAIMVRTASDAFSSVSTSVRDSAIAVGYSPLRRFFGVELPLAGPVLLAGIRVVSVSTVSLVSVGAFVGIPSLGNLFTDGFQRDFPTETWTGIVFVLLIAAVFDVILSTLGRVLLPWNRRGTRRRAARLVEAGAVS